MTLDDSVAIIVPKKHYHISSSSPDVSHLAFQVDMPVDKFSFVKLPPDLLERVFSEIEEQGISGNHARIADYLSFIASNFYEYPFAPAEKTTDYSFVIQSFLSLKYNTNIHLSDIAEELHVSIKQAERLVLLHTGNTFNNELTKYRITAAEQLAKLNPGLTVGEIANLVGYESHSGFWKAYKRFKKEKDN